MSPRILIDRADLTSRDDGEGNFTRFYNDGQTVSLTAEPIYGGLRFTGWRNVLDEQIGNDPTLTMKLTDHTQVHATYAAHEGLLAGDADGDGEVAFADFLLLAANFGQPADAVWADGDFNEDGRIEFADFLILAKNFGNNS
jgi:hypothetical protein